MPLASFSVVLEAAKPARVTVNGVELDPSSFSVLGVRPAPEPHGLPALVLEVQGEGTVTGQGVAIVNPDRLESEAIVEFLNALDPVQLDADCERILNDPSFSDDGSVTAALIEALRRRARG